MSDMMSVVNKVCLRESAYKLPLCLRFHSKRYNTMTKIRLLKVEAYAAYGFIKGDFLRKCQSKSRISYVASLSD